MDEKVNILVVDDLPDKLLAFQVVLEELGQNLVMVNSGAEALKQLLEMEFAVVLLDVNMPDIDGIETAELIRQHNKTKHTPIIFVTAYADEMQTARGYQLGAVDYILSPIVPEILRSKVRVFVELYRAQKRAQTLARAEAERAAAEEVTRRSNFLAYASRELGATLDPAEGAQRLMDIAVPGLADAAFLCLMLEGDELLFTRSVEGGEPATRDVSSLHALPRPLRDAVELVASEGRELDLPIWPDAEPFAEWPAGLRSARVLPIRAGERVFGVLVLASTRPVPAWALPDQAMIAELVGRAGIALENARLYWSLKREMAKTREAEEKLLEQSRRKDEFLAMLSHELRNPLAPIRNAVELLRRIAPSEPRLVWARDVVDRQVTHMAQLVDELLDVSRITQGKIKLKREPVELDKVIAHAVETARPLIDARGHSLEVRLPDSPVWLQADFARLGQVIANLLNNAAKYTQEGGRIELAASALNGEATLIVRDNGIGIDRDLLPRVFELFSQGERTLDRSLGGLGVGLTVVQRLVELHQGRVEVSSEGAGRGAEFKLVLPCLSEAGGATRAEREAAPRKERPVGCQRVLVVDDNVDAAESIAVLLRMEGHEVKTVGDARQALECCEVFAPGAIVLDIGLPGMDGYALAKALRAIPAARDALYIALTGYGQKDDRAAAEAAGFHHHFIKPADPRAVHAVITQQGGDAGVSRIGLGS
ncbi:MAG TPA: response regulator [Burkholderiales bacterium]|nr:response regulator [Burkholderiales bacterium]